ncbi:MAG: hypothetical protein KDD50_08790 [Bdellovibrionales bacterium]|nr:hypothetical protein [Bdellovibrionales bacterium]
MGLLKRLLTFSILVMAFKAGAQGLIVGEKRGYLSSVEDEENLIVYEIYFPKQTKEEEQFIKVLFDPKISKEIKQNYENTFGRTETEQNYYQPNQFDEVEYEPGVRLSAEEDLKRQKQYGEYMTSRLVEYHVDKYTKTNPKLKEVYEVKDQLSNMQLKTEAGYGLNFHYSISGNYFDFNLSNPFALKAKLILQMDQAKFGPTRVYERIVEFGYDLTKKFNVSTYYKTEDGVVSLVTTKQINPALSTSITASTYVREEGVSLRERLLLFGVSYTH